MVAVPMTIEAARAVAASLENNFFFMWGSSFGLVLRRLFCFDGVMIPGENEKHMRKMKKFLPPAPPGSHVLLILSMVY